MKRIFTPNPPYSLLFLLIIPLLIILAFTQGPSAGYTGSPLDNQDCTDCHESLPPGHLPNWISSDIPAFGYTPGETYTITLTAVGLVAVKMGFQITTETPTAKAGSFIITDAENTQLADAHTVTHTAAGTEVSVLPYFWTMDWQAPEEGTGDVTFYAIVNQSDNNNNNAGDLFFASELTVAEAGVGIAETEKPLAGNVFPNPALDNITIDVPVGADIRIFDRSGREAWSGRSHTKHLTINVGDLKPGSYYLQIHHEDQITIRGFIKK